MAYNSDWQWRTPLMMEFAACLEHYCNFSAACLLVINHIWQADLILPAWSFQDVQSAARICSQMRLCQMLRLLSLHYLVASLHQSLCWKFTGYEVISCDKNVTTPPLFGLIARLIWFIFSKAGWWFQYTSYKMYCDTSEGEKDCNTLIDLQLFVMHTDILTVLWLYRMCQLYWRIHPKTLMLNMNSGYLLSQCHVRS